MTELVPVKFGVLLLVPDFSFEEFLLNSDSSFAAGVDCSFRGEELPGLDSWLSLSQCAASAAGRFCRRRSSRCAAVISNYVSRSTEAESESVALMPDEHEIETCARESVSVESTRRAVMAGLPKRHP